ncbi:MAG: 5-formyltetrahydrofolate cyclo-ligase [Lachnospiraceae bacterium]|jgi:5-formyltetrahydrofolate cyclo-ligase|nr:5-formyltetrahydrofolate cyclo-ligase [Lachnospiraceae bacterium]
METKKQIRAIFLKKRDALSGKQRAEESAMITAHILASSFYKEADSVLLFASYRTEADTFSLAGQVLCDHKKLYYPVVLGKEMEFYRVESLEELKEGYCGIPEPDALAERQFTPLDCGKVLMLMPGVCFDRAGGRIGYGGGFYDRYLEHLKSKPGVELVTAALAFSCQIAEDGAIPKEQYDISPDYIVSSKEGVIHCRI